MKPTFFLYVFLWMCLLSMVTGCDRQTQYSLLTIVFTGVPPMEELYGESRGEETVSAKESIADSRQVMFQHPLWATKQCTKCHEANTILEEHLAHVEAGSEVTENIGSQPAPGLILPVNKLCISCHRDKTARRAIRERLWMHNPVAKGDCVSCHHHHQSHNRAHLKQTRSTICSSCHESAQLPDVCLEELPPDQTTESCTDCHNVHVGRDHFLLNRDFNEIKIPAGH